MQYLRQQHATGATSLSDQCKIHGDWKTKQKRLLYQHCHCHQLYIQLQKLQNVSFTFIEMTVIDYIKTIFISTGTRIWHSHLFGILYHHVNHVDVDASFDVTSKRDAIIPYHTIFSFFVLHSWCVNRFIFPFESRTTTLVLGRKNTNSKSTEANEETKVLKQNRCTNSNKKSIEGLIPNVKH